MASCRPVSWWLFGGCREGSLDCPWSCLKITSCATGVVVSPGHPWLLSGVCSWRLSRLPLRPDLTCGSSAAQAHALGLEDVGSYLRPASPESGHLDPSVTPLELSFLITRWAWNELDPMLWFWGWNEERPEDAGLGQQRWQVGPWGEWSEWLMLPFICPVLPLASCCLSPSLPHLATCSPLQLADRWNLSFSLFLFHCGLFILCCC